MEASQNHDFSIHKLGPAKITSPISLSRTDFDLRPDYVHNDEFILYNIKVKGEKKVSYHNEGFLEKAGPRELIYFDPAKFHAGIVTCGGLCPGLNDVIRSIVMTLWYHYGVRRISGFQFGYRGLLPEFKLPSIDLSPDKVAEIHAKGGTILGSSRGSGDRVEDIVDSIERMNLSALFVIGGDGSQKGSRDIAKELERRHLKIAIIGIPKTIDNDLSFIQRSFGFETAVSHAVAAVTGAHVEARDAVNGISIVKLMGRESGFIAAYTTLGTNDVNYVLVPEIPFDLEGPKGLLANLKQRLANRNHALIVVAEGAGRDLMPQSKTLKDASGNMKFDDIGLFLKDAIAQHFKKENISINIKYIDPSYLIRSHRANPNDSILCARLGANAVHAAMSGRTNMIVSLLHDTYVHVPIELVVQKRNKIDPESSLWRDVLAATGQPALMKN